MKSTVYSFKSVAIGLMLGSLLALGIYTLLLVYLPIEHFTTVHHTFDQRATAFTQWKIKDQEYRHRYFYRGLALGCLSLLGAAATHNLLLIITLLSEGLFTIGGAFYTYWNYLTLLEFLAALIIIILSIFLTVYLLSHYTMITRDLIKRGVSLCSELILGTCIATLITALFLVIAYITSWGSPFIYTVIALLAVIAGTFMPQDFLGAGFFLTGTLLIIHQGFLHVQHSRTPLLLLIMIITLALLTYYAYQESKKDPSKTNAGVY